jgi:hypothetical protein
VHARSSARGSLLCGPAHHNICSDAFMYRLCAARRVYAAFHPTAFETSLVRHQEGAVTSASMLATDINEGRYEPSAPGEHCSVPSVFEPAMRMDHPAYIGPEMQQVQPYVPP